MENGGQVGSDVRVGWGVNARVTVNERQSGTPTLTHLAHSKRLLVVQKVWEGI